MIRFFYVFIVLLFATPPAWAQGNDSLRQGMADFQKGIDKAMKEMEKSKKEGKEEHTTTTGNNHTSSLIMRWGDGSAPIEPEIPVVTYLKIDPPKVLQRRVEGLLHNIYIDVPPEYDHYGYEIRRYMARIGGPYILGNKEALIGQLQNINNAKIVLGYWRRSLDKEITAIEKEIEKGGVQPSIRSTFRYNKAVVYAFLTECNQWIKHNKAFSEYLIEITGGYRYVDPEFTFYNRKYRREFKALHGARKAAHQEIIEYAPFQGMVY